MDNYNELWQSVLTYCKERITDTAYDLWLSKIEIKSFEKGCATLSFSNEFKKSTVVAQYGDLISEAFEKICGFPVEIIYVSPEDLISEDKKNFLDLENFKNDILTFDNFIVGPSNKFAYTAAKAIAAEECLLPSYKEYIHQVVLNCKAMCEEFKKMGYKVITDGTDNHLFLLDLTHKGITGIECQEMLDVHHITLNKNCIPQETRSPKIASGVRIGTAAMTTKGYKEKDFIEVAHKIDQYIDDFMKSKK